MTVGSTERGAPTLIRSVGLLTDGPQPWGRPVAARGPGIYIVELPDPPTTAPIDAASVGRWLERTPGLRLDGAQPTPKELAARVAAFWLPGQPVLYAGSTTTSIGGRIASLVAHVPGDRRPHADGQWLHLLRGLQRARLWWASTDAPQEYLDALLAAFADGVSAAERALLPDSSIVLPFATIRTPTGERKPHGITGAIAPEPPTLPAPSTHVVDVPPGDADGARAEPKGTGTIRRPAAPRPGAAGVPRGPARSSSGRTSAGRTTVARTSSRTPARPRPEPAYLSADGLARLRSELDELRGVRRPDVIARIRAAKELGDLRENADYHAAREEQSFLEGRIQSLESLLRDAVVIEAAASGTSGVVRGSRVRLEHDGEIVTYAIVGSSEADPAAGRISAESPVGAALLGRVVGDDVAVRTPNGAVRYRIVAID